MAWLKLKDTSQVELFHLLFSEAHRPCLEALRGEIRGFLISRWDTCLSQLPIPIIQNVVKSVETMSMCVCLSHVCLYSLHFDLFMHACSEYRVCEGKEGSLLIRENC